MGKLRKQWLHRQGSSENACLTGRKTWAKVADLTARDTRLSLRLAIAHLLREVRTR